MDFGHVHRGRDHAGRDSLVIGKRLRPAQEMARRAVRLAVVDRELLGLASLEGQPCSGLQRGGRGVIHHLGFGGQAAHHLLAAQSSPGRGGRIHGQIASRAILDGDRDGHGLHQGVLEIELRLQLVL
ncbi:hypothetical protein D3C81_1853170 [compost metagenome]